jgi:hypothetical protein
MKKEVITNHFMINAKSHNFLFLAHFPKNFIFKKINLKKLSEISVKYSFFLQIFTNDPMLTALGLPQYPPLPAATEPAKVEEIRRTVYVGNLKKGCDPNQLLSFFNACIGEVFPTFSL